MSRSLLFLLSFTAIVHAQISKNFGEHAASDLVDNGEKISSWRALYLSNNTKLDISKLNPSEDVNIWKDESYTRALPDDEKIIDIKYNDTVEYVSIDEGASSGKTRFGVIKKDALGIPRLYNAVFDTKGFNQILRRNLLYKIGYKTSPVKRVDRLVVKFPSLAEKTRFFGYIKLSTGISFRHWAVEEINESTVAFRDVYLSEPNLTRLELNSGDLTPDLIKNRRVLSALAVPFALVQAPESINIMRWHSGLIENNTINLVTYPNAPSYNTGYEDARWISNRILKLNEGDWADIVDATNLPGPVQTLLLAKLKTRRNNLRKLFKLKARELNVKKKKELTDFPYLINGVLEQCAFENYSSTFCYGKEQFALRGEELNAMIKSKFWGLVIDGAMTAFNEINFLSTDVKAKNEEKIEELSAQALAKYMKTGVPTEREVKSWAFPTFGGGLIISRNIIAGSYLGTNNTIQLADNFGFYLSAGAFIGIAGLPSPFVASGGTQAKYSRTYSHIRPIESIMKARKYSYKNLIVPLLRKRYSKRLEEFGEDEAKLFEESGSLTAQAINFLKEFKKSMNIGESLIVTDSLGTGLALSAGVKVMNLVQIKTAVSPAKVIIARTHITKVSENTFQIYKDFGNVNQLGIHQDLDAGVPVLRASFKLSKGKATSKLFTLDLSQRNPNLFDHIVALRETLLGKGKRALLDTQEPFVLKHNFKQNNKDAMVFVFSGRKLKSNTLMTLTNPNKNSQDMFRYYMGSSVGINYERYISELISFLTNKLFKTSFKLSGLAEASAGNSFFGKAKNRVLTFEALVDENQKFERPYVTLSRSWNGWKIKQEKAQKIIDKIEERYIEDFFPDGLLNDTSAIFVYNIMMNFKIYQEGVDSIMSQNEKALREVFDNSCHSCKGFLFFKNQSVERILQYQRKYQKWRDEKKLKRKRLKKMSYYALKVISIAEQKLDLKGLKTLLGGEDNFFAQGKVIGFRESDERSDKLNIDTNKLSSHSVGVNRESAPLAAQQNSTGLVENNGVVDQAYKGFSAGEFYLYWLMSRIY